MFARLKFRDLRRRLGFRVDENASADPANRLIAATTHADHWTAELSNFVYKTPLLPIAIALAIGILVDHTFAIATFVWLSMAVIVTAGGKIWERVRRPSPVVRWAWVCGVVFAIGGARHGLDRETYQSARPHFAKPNTAGHAETNRSGGVVDTVSTIVHGRIVSVPQFVAVPPSLGRDDRAEVETRMIIQTSAVRSGLSMVPCRSRLRLVIDGASRVERGDRVEVFGRWRLPSPPSNPSGFDGQWFARNQSLHGSMRANRVGDVIVIGDAHWSQKPAAWIRQFSMFGRDVLIQHCGPDIGPIAVAMVLGQRESIPSATRDQLLATGTVHLLSVSGLHLAIVVSMVTTLLSVLPLRQSVRLAIILIVAAGYVALTGGRPPVVRAAVLVATLWLGYAMGRSSNSYNALSLAAITLMMFAPRNLFGVGVVLSFVAVVSLIAAGQRLLELNAAAVDADDDVEAKMENLVTQSRPYWQRRLIVYRGAMRSILWSSVCVTAMTTPLVWYHFHVVSPIAVLVNLLLTPLLAISLGSGLVTVATAMFSDAIAIIPGAVTWISTSVMAWIVRGAAEIQWGHFWLPSPAIGMVWGFYGTMLAMMFLPRSRKTRTLKIVFSMLWFAFAYASVSQPKPLTTGETRLIFVDVGHGTAVVVRRGIKNYLYDCGRLGNDEFHARDIEDVLWHERITRLDAVILSHADVDHFNALPTLLKRFRIDNIYTPPGMIDEDEAAIAIIQTAIKRAGKQVDEICSGDRIEGFIDVLHPTSQRDGGSDNSNSLVIEIDHPKRSILLPGDIEPPGTRRLTNTPRPKPGGVLMAPHHGSLRMRADLVLSWARPSIVVVSGGYRAAKVEVEEMLSQTGADVFVTSKAGATRVVVDQDGVVTVRQWLDEPW